MITQWCKQTLWQAIKDHSKPEMINTDQGSQFTATEFTEFVTGEGITFSMDGKGRAIDNIFIERFWRNIKYEKSIWNRRKTDWNYMKRLRIT